MTPLNFVVVISFILLSYSNLLRTVLFFHLSYNSNVHNILYL